MDAGVAAQYSVVHAYEGHLDTHSATKQSRWNFKLSLILSYNQAKVSVPHA